MTLSGGGFAGGGAVVGFACAVDLFLLSHSVTQLASYSGVSAGAIIGAYLAAGVSPLEIVQSTFRSNTGGRWIGFRRRDLYRPNLREIPRTALRAGKALRGRLGRLVSRGRPEATDGDAPRELGVLPSGILSNEPLRRVIRANLDRFARTNDFSDLDCGLRVVFYDLLGNQRIVAGNGPLDLTDIPIDEAVTASAAIPGVYTPRRIRHRGRTLLGVDGGTAGVTLDVRVEDDLDILIAYNHMGFAKHPGAEHASALSVLNLARQLLANQRNLDELATYMDANPSRHVWYFEPPPMPISSMLSYRAMLTAGRRVFELTKAWLAQHRDYFGLLLEDQGVTVNRDLASVEFDDIIAKGPALKDELAPA
jgi:predicted acylesterase/phospholipase RssA